MTLAPGNGTLRFFWLSITTSFAGSLAKAMAGSRNCEGWCGCRKQQFHRLDSVRGRGSLHSRHEESPAGAGLVLAGYAARRYQVYFAPSCAPKKSFSTPPSCQVSEP
jgi:hypothetical protein